MKKIIIFITSLLMPFTIFAYSNKVILGGSNIGINIESNGILIVGFYKVNNTLNDSKLRVGDYIIKVNGENVTNIKELVDTIEKNVLDNKVEITYRRNNIEDETPLKLEKVNGVYKTGLYVKDSLTGLGTLTYIDPVTKIYGALGHEILESTTNTKVEVKTGNIFKSEVTSITKSEDRNPGTKNAKFYKNIIYGNIEKNENAGIYGTYTDNIDDDDLIEIVEAKDIHKGEAYIVTELDDKKVNEYKINILKVEPNSNIKNIYFEVIDEKLLEKTGGIVQGMSGSPIIQDNKLIGAVTHVSVDQVNKGYGISIITMLKKGEEK